MTRREALSASGAALLASTTVAGHAAAAGAKKILIYGHRGASALRPEHTIASYAKAIADGAASSSPISSRPRTAC